jgi:hypothetical protein
MRPLTLFLAPTLAGLVGGAIGLSVPLLGGARFGYVGFVAGWLAASWVAAALALHFILIHATAARRRAVAIGAVIGALIGAAVFASLSYYMVLVVGPVLGCALIGVGAAFADDVAP